MALIVLVLERSGSALVAGLVTTAALLPWVGAGQLLAALGDRWSRRTILVSDLVRAAVFAARPLTSTRCPPKATMRRTLFRLDAKVWLRRSPRGWPTATTPTSDDERSW